MTKDDRQFMKGLIKDLDKKFDKIDERFDALENKVDKNTEGINRNGVMIEKLQDLIYSVAENNTGLSRRLSVVENYIDIE